MDGDRFTIAKTSMWAAFAESVGEDIDTEDSVHIACHGLIVLGSCYRFYWPEMKHTGLTWKMMKQAVGVARAVVLPETFHVRPLRLHTTELCRLAEHDPMARVIWRIMNAIQEQQRARQENNEQTAK
jgi:hypothetical protein